MTYKYFPINYIQTFIILYKHEIKIILLFRGNHKHSVIYTKRYKSSELKKNQIVQLILRDESSSFHKNR